MRNRAICKSCDTIIESTHQHDFVSCKCGECFVDGGDSYKRYGFKRYRNFSFLDDKDQEIAWDGLKIPFPDCEYAQELRGAKDFGKSLRLFLQSNNFPALAEESIWNLLNSYEDPQKALNEDYEKMREAHLLKSRINLPGEKS